MAILNQERLQRRKHGRAQAETILSLVDLPHRDCVDAFLDELQRRLRPEVVAVAADQKQRTIRDLAATEIQFGKYAGRTFGQTDRQYLEWLCESSRQMIDSLGEYLELTGESTDEE